MSVGTYAHITLIFEATTEHTKVTHIKWLVKAIMLKT